jgi:hypothetical protein
MGKDASVRARKLYEQISNQEEIIAQVAELIVARSNQVKELPWGSIVHDQRLDELLNNGLLDTLNQYLNAELTMYEVSIALVSMHPDIPHGRYMPVVPNDNVEINNEKQPLPVRLYIPLSGELLFNTNSLPIVVGKGDVFSVFNGATVDFISLEMSEIEFLIIDIPQYYPGKDILL